jgi:hypothetical protein
MNPIGTAVVSIPMLQRLEGMSARVLAATGAALLVVSGLIHLHLWDIAYRHVDTLGPLFIVQTVAALVLAVLLLAWPNRVVVGAAILLAAGTIAGFVKADNGGIFGFTLPVVTSWAKWALAAEIGVIAVLVVALAVDRVELSRRAGAPAATPTSA